MRLQVLNWLPRLSVIWFKEKSYAKIIGESPEFTVMFLPNEAMLHQALATDPTLLDFAAQNENYYGDTADLDCVVKSGGFLVLSENQWLRILRKCVNLRKSLLIG